MRGAGAIAARWWEEARFCLRLGAGPSDGLRLLRSTLGFHLADHVPGLATERALDARPHRVRLDGRLHELWLRPRSGDWFVLHEVLRLGAYRLPPAITARVEFVVDLGANVGLTALYYASTIAGARVACVEPARENAELLRRNVAGLGGRATVLEAAVAPTCGSVTFLEAQTWGGRVSDGPGGYRVEALDVPTILARAGFPRIDLLKVDIEGAEEALLGTGDRAWLHGVQALVIKLHGGYSSERLARDLAPYGLRVEEPSDEHPMLVATRRR